MALHALHQTLNSITKYTARPSILICSLRLKVPNKVCAAFITSKDFRDPEVVKPKPWPYERRGFNYLHSFLDRTTTRFDENTKLIVVDGNIAAGKTTLAQKLAEEFDMKFVPEPNMDRYYINPYGYDLREIDELMPPSFKACDLKTFYSNPQHRNVAMFQFRMYMARFTDYMDALAHLLNTGQGIVMDRSVYSDFVFMETMHKAGYIRREARDYYMELYNICMRRLLRPHLIVYLDVPVETIMERIKARNNPIEVNSKVLTKDYLQSLEDFYKTRHLKNLKEHTEILMYDWSNYGDVEVVVEDIENIDFEQYGDYDTNLSDWRYNDHWQWSWHRRRFTSQQERIIIETSIFRPEVWEYHIPQAEANEYEEILAKVPGSRYEKGYNPDMGDNYLFKLK